MNLKGRFITLEGIDGAGKTTYVPWIINLLKKQGIRAIRTREPGGSHIGEVLRKLILHNDMQIETETLLILATRVEHVRTLIEPALLNGTWVVCDRFSDATYAYQGYGRKVPINIIKQLESCFQINLTPDKTWLFDLPLDIARMRSIRSLGRCTDRFEEEKLEFFEEVRNGYLIQAKNHSERINLVDSTQSEDTIKSIIKADIVKLVSKFL